MSKDLSSIYTKAMVDEIVARLSRTYIAAIKELSEENWRLKKKLCQMERKEPANDVVADTETSLDMDKILRPDQNLNLENLCKELGLMDDND
jgi:hypothetical protein